MSFINFKKKDNEKRNDELFEKEIFAKVAFWNSGFLLLTMFYAIVLGRITSDNLVFAIITGILLCVGLNYVLLLSLSPIVVHSVSEELASFYYYDTTEKERTKLMKRLMSLPSTIAVVVFIVYILCSAGWVTLLAKVAKVDSEALILISGIMFLGAYYSAAYTLTESAHKVCSKHASHIVAKGVSKLEVDRIHLFGTKSSVMTALYIFIPIFVSAAFLFLLAWRAYVSYMVANVLFFRLFFVMIVCVGSYVYFGFKLFHRMMHSVSNMRQQMTGINRENLHKVKSEDTDLSNEFMYNVYLINTIVSILQKILKESQDISMSVVESSNELSVISRETAVTSLEQNSGVKELLSAMEESDNLSKNIASKISEVSIVAKKTTENIVDGFDILKMNMQKLDEIKAANDVTVEGIKKLTEKISGISEIARIINGIADQTNIIAFNAEIEASSAGDVGENFALVANEIRRLTNNTIQSTNEIRKRIVEIQNSSDVLLASSQNGSNKIYDGTQIINELNDRFEELKESSEAMDYASEDIKKIIDQQTASFAQIVVTLRQITAAAETFSSSTQKISESAQNLCVISESLKALQPEDEAVQVAVSADESSEVK